VTTCNHCGRPTLAGMAHCQNCGWPLTTTIGDGNVPGMAAPEQPELPAWLESLRSGGSATGNTGSSYFSAADLVDEGMLPGWMRPGREENVDNTPSGSHPARRPASMPAPNTENALMPTKGMMANSLIDEQSLPSWMQGQQEGSSSAGQEGISAASLVQPGALPDWIRSIETQSPAPPSTPPGPVQYPHAEPAQQPVSGHELIDQQALPQWMSGQDTSVPAGGQSGLSASSLLDAQSLPTWLREESQEQRNRYAGSPQPAQAGQAPDYQVPIGQGQIPNPGMQNNLAAASLIDMNALPDWMRPNDEQRPGMASYPPQQNPAEYPRQASFGAPSRPENKRVPSRPRVEMGYVEESEVAANTFASMLGVASVAPNFPGQQSRDASGPSQPLSQSQPYAAPPGSMQGQQTPPSTFQEMPPNQNYGPAQGRTSAGYQMGQMPNNVPGMQPASTMHNDQSNSNKKPAKRGFLSTILDWFSLSR
jgi:hypothetical protein